MKAAQLVATTAAPTPRRRGAARPLARVSVSMSMSVLVLVLVLVLALTALGAHANEAAPLADDPVVEQRLLTIAEEVRCLVCQNESLAGSRADLAQDLRREIRGLIRQGKTDAEVMEFLVSRYGDYVRYRPPVKPSTWLLWGGPFVLLAAGIAGLLMFVRRRPRAPSAELTPDEQREAAALLGGADR